MTKQIVLSEPFDLGSLNGNRTDISFRANPEERQQVLDIIKITGVKSLEGDITIKPWHRTGFILTGEIRSTVVQTCVVTLEPVDEQVVEPFERTYIRSGEAEQEEPDEDVEVDFILEAEDPPEILIGHTLNLLEIIAEHLALGLEAYPRKSGAEIDSRYQAGSESDEKPNPFDVLKQLKDQ